MITITSLWILALGVLLFFLGLSVRTVRRALRCPILGTDVQVKFLEALPEGRPIEVTACSALKPPTNIVCDQRCLGLLAHPAKRPADDHPTPMEIVPDIGSIARAVGSVLHG